MKMKKTIFSSMLIIASIVFMSCDAPTQVMIVESSTEKQEFGVGAKFTDFFDPVELVHSDEDYNSTAIVMDKNTGVLYVRKVSGYKWGMSPIYDSDGSVLTKEKWLVKRAEKKN